MEFAKHCLARSENSNSNIWIWPNEAIFGDFLEELSPDDESKTKHSAQKNKVAGRMKSFSTEQKQVSKKK